MHIGKSLYPTQVFKYLDNHQLLTPVNNICHEIVFHLAIAKANYTEDIYNMEETKLVERWDG